MAARFALYSTDISPLAMALGQPTLALNVVPNYSVSPNTYIDVLARIDGGRVSAEKFFWGYKPGWANDRAPQPINAKAETVATMRYFAGNFRHHRCLIPANGWFEWKQGKEGKTPYYLTSKKNELLYFAGVWTERGIDNDPSLAIITEPAHGEVANLQARMPMILASDSLINWLDPMIQDGHSILGMTHSLDPQEITYWPVGTAINTPGKHVHPDVISPITPH